MTQVLKPMQVYGTGTKNYGYRFDFSTQKGTCTRTWVLWIQCGSPGCMAVTACLLLLAAACLLSYVHTFDRQRMHSFFLSHHGSECKETCSKESKEVQCKCFSLKGSIGNSIKGSIKGSIKSAIKGNICERCVLGFSSWCFLNAFISPTIS